MSGPYDGRVETIYAWVCDEDDQGILGITFPGRGTLPMVFVDPQIGEAFKGAVEEMVRETGRSATYARFERIADIDDISPRLKEGAGIGGGT